MDTSLHRTDKFYPGLLVEFGMLLSAWSGLAWRKPTANVVRDRTEWANVEAYLELGVTIATIHQGLGTTGILCLPVRLCANKSE